MQKKAFTLIELLVVITILVTLLAILRPSIRRSVDAARVVSCASRMRQVQLAWIAFMPDHGNVIPRGQPGGTAGSPNEYFVADGNTYSSIAYGSLYPYVGQRTLTELNAMSVTQREQVLSTDPGTTVFKCPADPNPNLRTWSIVGPMRGEGYTSTSQMGTDRFTSILNHAMQAVLVEEQDYRSAYNVGSWLMPVTETSKWHWTDYTAPFHDNKTSQNMGFADGHIELWQWVDDTTLDAAHESELYVGKGDTAAHNPPFFAVSYEHGIDWKRMRVAYRQLNSTDDNSIIYYRNADAIQ
ncbi:MAG: DUF1559 domain-containing protein [Planctomycetes bacterium]|nr:DUF1559 domain-containing protein [Planctomycetota bacterium]